MNLSFSSAKQQDITLFIQRSVVFSLLVGLKQYQYPQNQVHRSFCTTFRVTRVAGYFDRNCKVVSERMTASPRLLRTVRVGHQDLNRGSSGHATTIGLGYSQTILYIHF